MTLTMRFFSLLFATFFIAGCAHKVSVMGTNDAQAETNSGFWSGRMSLQIQSDPTQAFFAGFELKGQAENGELSLISPLGSILGVMRWSDGEATLTQAGSTQRFSSTDELLAKATGAAVPVAALFDWLRGKNTAVPGWLADLSQQNSGRISAKRIDPAPQAELRIVLEK